LTSLGVAGTVAQCAGNSLEPDVRCTAPATLRPHAASIAVAAFNESDKQCCHIASKCTGNTDNSSDVICAQPSQLRKYAALIDQGAHPQRSCCVVSGLCTGNSDRAAEPDVHCVAPARLRLPGSSNATWVAGRDTDSCCITSGMCIVRVTFSLCDTIGSTCPVD
jgi:hypothetical protein